MITQTLKVKGMHCASCASIIGRKVSDLSGVEEADVNFATEKANIKFDPSKVSVKEMNDEIEKLGYKLVEHEGMDHSTHTGLGVAKEEKLKELEVMRRKTRFVMPVALLVFAIMLWEILSKATAAVPALAIPMNLLNPISLVLAPVVMFWIGKRF